MTPDDLARILDELGQRLGPTGEYVFGLAVKQARIDATIGLVLIAIGTVVGLVALAVGFRYVDLNNPKVMPADYAALFGIVTLCLTLFIGLTSVSMIVTGLANPEYAALRDLLSRIVP